MAKIWAFLFSAFVVGAVSPAAHAKTIRVVTTTNYIGALTETLGGEKVSIESLSPAGFDADNYSARPQDLFKIHQAKLFIMIGLNLEDWARDPATKDRLITIMKTITFEEQLRRIDNSSGNLSF